MTTEIHRRIAALGDDDPALRQLEAFAWREYVRPRAAVGSKQEREMRARFVKTTDGAYDRMYAEAKRRGQRVEFSLVRLRLLAIAGLEVECPFGCGLFGVETLAFTYDTPAGSVDARPWRVPNIIVCDTLCATAKGPLTAYEFRELVAALTVADQTRARVTLEALAIGRLRGAAKGRGSFLGGGPRG